MLPRNIFSGLAVLALSVAVPAGSGMAASQARGIGQLGHAGGSPAGDPDRPVVLAQAADPRLTTLEEEIRKLNGRVEELNFQILQMQDQMRRMQEDTDFRFQELQGGGSGAGDAAPQRKSERLDSAPPTLEQSTATALPAPSPDRSTATIPPALPPTAGTPAERGAPPRTLGTITFDQNGNIISTGAGQPIDLLQGTPVENPDGSIVAALPPSNDPDEIYRSSYQFILSGDYKTAEAGFRQYLDRFPDGEHAADANFWLGEAMLGQDRYREAAEVFLQANRSYPDAKKAPDMLLKLGVSLAAMNQRDVACATYEEIGKRYPDISSALKQRVKQEQALSGC